MSTSEGWWKAPTRFLPAATLIPVLPPTELSTCASRLVGTCTKLQPRLTMADAKPATSPTTPPPRATLIVSMASPALRAVQQLLVGEDQRHHRFDNRRGADADARIVPALGDDLRFVPFAVDRRHRRQDRRGRLEGDAHDHRLPARNAAEDPTGMVGEESRSGAHRIGIFLAAQARRGEAVADLDALGGVDRHHRSG